MVDRIDRPFALGLIGYPLAHSLSPRLHNAALRATGLEGEYRLYPVPPLPEGKEALDSVLDRLRRGDLRGLNVTIPHKQPVMARMDKLIPRARIIGAVNTLFMQDGLLMGDNTDAAGFLAALGHLLPLEEMDPWENPAPSALVLGAGGSARAVVYALANAGWQVTVAARRPEQAQNLAASLRTHLESALPIRHLPMDPDPLRLNPPPRLIVNTTPVGMYRQVHEPAGASSPSQAFPAFVADTLQSPWPEELPFPAGAVVFDLVYNPPITPLVQAARTSGLLAANGLGMLLEQAALSFERWTGVPAPRHEMAQALEIFE